MEALPLARTGRHRQAHRVVATLSLAVAVLYALALSAGALTPASHGTHHHAAAVLAPSASAAGPGAGHRLDLHADVSGGVPADPAGRAAAAPVLRPVEPDAGLTDSVRTRGPPPVV